MGNTVDIAVIGGGIAGLTAVQHALTSGRSVAHVMGLEAIGGQVCNVGELRGWPGGAEPLSGIDLAIGLMSANAAAGAFEVVAEVTGVAREGDGFRVTHSDGDVAARQVIVATGARLKMLDVPGAAALVGRGVSQCAWCDGPLYQGQHAVVVGGGDAALEEALHLAGFAGQVTLLVRDGFRGRRAYVDAVDAHPAIEVRRGFEVVEVAGEEQVTGVGLRNREDGTTDRLACNGVFVFIGQVPNSEWLGDLVERDATGGIVTDAAMETATPGLFAIGAVRAGYGGRLVHAVGEAATAALAAARR